MYEGNGESERGNERVAVVGGSKSMERREGEAQGGKAWRREGQTSAQEREREKVVGVVGVAAAGVQGACGREGEGDKEAGSLWW